MNLPLITSFSPKKTVHDLAIPGMVATVPGYCSPSEGVKFAEIPNGLAALSTAKHREKL